MRVTGVGVYYGQPVLSAGVMLNLGSSTIRRDLYGLAWVEYVRIA